MQFFIAGIPYPKVATGKEEAEAWTCKVRSATAGLPKLSGPCAVDIEFRLPASRFSLGYPYGTDLDNLTKRLLDGLNRTVFSDAPSKDGCVLRMTISKLAVFGEGEEGAWVQIIGIGTPSEEGRFLHFAYGSNMHQGRLEERVGEVRKIGNAFLPVYRLRTNKMSVDGSAKANIERSVEGSSGVWGVLWSVDGEKKSNLDRAEGYRPNHHDSQYKPENLIVFCEGIPYIALAYLACKNGTTPEDGEMYDWYHDFIIKGARYNDIPSEYQNLIVNLPSRKDTNAARTEENVIILKSWPSGVH